MIQETLVISMLLILSPLPSQRKSEKSLLTFYNASMEVGRGVDKLGNQKTFNESDFTN